MSFQLIFGGMSYNYTLHKRKLRTTIITITNCVLFDYISRPRAVVLLSSEPGAASEKVKLRQLMRRRRSLCFLRSVFLPARSSRPRRSPFTSALEAWRKRKIRDCSQSITSATSKRFVLALPGNPHGIDILASRTTHTRHTLYINGI